MPFQPLEIPDVILVTPHRFEDARGYFSESYNRRLFRDNGISCEFVQDNESLSLEAGTVRGLHCQVPPCAQGKLVKVTHGAIFDVAVDVRRDSPTYGRHVAVRLDAEVGAQLFVPEGFLHGFCTLEPNTRVAYKVSDFYSKACDRSIRWNDPLFAIEWPVSPDEAHLSEKDRNAPRLKDVQDLFG